MKIVYSLLSGLLFLISQNIIAQLNIKVSVLGVGVVNTVNCDGGPDNSDFVFEFNATDNSPFAYSNNAPVAGSIGMCNYVSIPENNGPYSVLPASPGTAVFSPANGIFFDRNYNCKQDVPTSITLTWTGYENDDAGVPSTTPIAGGTIAPQTNTITIPLSASTYTAQYSVTSADGSCAQTYAIVFSIKKNTGAFAPLNILSASGHEICTGAADGDVEVVVNGGSGTVTYDWSNDGTTDFDDNAVATGLAGGTYTIVIKDALNCTDTATASITEVNAPLPITEFTDSTITVCTNQSGVLYAVAAQNGVTYEWAYSGSGITLATYGYSATVNFLNNATGGILSVFAQNGCTVTPTHTMTINVIQSPSVSVSGSANMCDNAQETLTASGATSYTWSTGVNTATAVVTPTALTIYTVTGESNGCQTSIQHTITVMPSPTVQISGSTLAVCPDVTVALTATGNGALFLWSDGFIGPNHTVSAPATTIYTVTHTYTNSCFAQETFTLNVSPLPSIAITGTANVCAGQLFTITATGADTYTWSNGSNNATLTDGVFGPMTLTVTGTNTTTTCSNTQTVSVDTYSIGMVAITGNTTICSGVPEVYQVTGSDFYVWDNGATAGTNTITATGPTTLSVVGTNVHGCKDSTTFVLDVVATPTVSIAGPDSICSGQSTVLNTTVTGATSYSWNTGATTTGIAVAPVNTTTYSVLAYNGGCMTTANHIVNLKPLPIISFTGADSICSGQSASLNVNALASSTYSWDNGATTSGIVVMPTSTTSYTVLVTHNSCSETKIHQVFVTPMPVVSVSGNDTICNGQTASLTANAIGASTYTWSTGANTQNINDAPVNTTTYVVTVSENGCMEMAFHEVFVKPSPVINFNLASNVVCDLDASFTFSATPTGGTYSGTGVSGQDFDPAGGVGFYPVTYQVSGSNGCTATQTQTIEVSACVGVKENEANNFAVKVYPVPASTSVFIDADIQLKQINIYDYTGKLIAQSNINSLQYTIDVSSFAKGLYTVVMTAHNNSITTIKIVKE